MNLLPADPPWLVLARDYIGTAEITGKKHNPRVVQLWEQGRVPMKVTDDETPWCAAFVSAILEMSNINSARTGWARAYANWGEPLSHPIRGAICVLSRGRNYGHVGFVAGKDRRGNILLLGGNQEDAVNVKPFDPGRVIRYRWPSGYPIPENPVLPTLLSSGRLSTNEA